MTTLLVVSLLVSWIVFSAILVTIICMNSSRLSRIDERLAHSPERCAAEKREYTNFVPDWWRSGADSANDTPVQELFCSRCGTILNEHIFPNKMCSSCFQDMCDDANKPLVPDEPQDERPSFNDIFLRDDEWHGDEHS